MAKEKEVKTNVKAKEKDVKKKKKSRKKKTPKESYLKGVKKELKLVKWPSAKEVLKYTISTIIMCLILCGIFMLLDALLAVVKGWF